MPKNMDDNFNERIRELDKDMADAGIVDKETRKPVEFQKIGAFEIDRFVQERLLFLAKHLSGDEAGFMQRTEELLYLYKTMHMKYFQEDPQ